jgi:hypothetical protein
VSPALLVGLRREASTVSSAEPRSAPRVSLAELRTVSLRSHPRAEVPSALGEWRQATGSPVGLRLYNEQFIMSNDSSLQWIDQFYT